MHSKTAKKKTLAVYDNPAEDRGHFTPHSEISSEQEKMKKKIKSMGGFAHLHLVVKLFKCRKL